MSPRTILKGIFRFAGLTLFNRSGKVNIWTTQEVVADAGKVLMVITLNGGHGHAQLGDGEEYAIFSFSSTGDVITLISNSANVTTTENSDTNFNIYNAGDRIGFNNELGSTKNLFVTVWWN